MTKDLHSHVGHTAGRVYRTLEKEKKPMSALSLSLKLKAWPWEVTLALGWLSREDKVKLWRNFFAVMAELK